MANGPFLDESGLKSFKEKLDSKFAASSDLSGLLARVEALEAKTRDVPTGCVEYFALSAAPSGWLIANGQAVSRADYADLFGAIGTTFGDGDGSTTFNLPDLIDRFAQGGSSVGAVKDAGLPNITGTVKMHGQASQTPVYEVFGSFVATEKPAAYAELSSLRSTAAPSVGVFDFDAAQSSSIYGSSSTVQPPALVLLPCIKT